MPSNNMLVIRDRNGEIIAAQVLDVDNDEYATFIRPSQDDQTLHEITDVPATIRESQTPDDLHLKISEYLKEGNPQLRQVSVEEVREGLSRRFPR